MNDGVLFSSKSQSQKVSTFEFQSTSFYLYLTKEPCQDWEKEVKMKTKNNIVMQQHAVDKSGGLEAKILASASASNIWPRPGLDLVVLLCSRAFLGKNHVKFGNFVKFFR